MVLASSNVQQELPARGNGSDMEHVTKIMNDGLAKIRATIMKAHRDVYTQLRIPVDRNLFAAPIVLPDGWDHFRSGLSRAKLHTAFHRYQKWYQDSFRGEKRKLSDSDFSPSEDSETDEELVTQSQPLPRRNLPRRAKRLARDDGAVG